MFFLIVGLMKLVMIQGRPLLSP